MNDQKTIARKVLTYLTIAVVSIGLLTTGLGFVVDIVQRDSAIVSNKSAVIALQEEVKALRKVVVRMDKQLVAISTKLEVAIIEEEN